jgi:hypothetical protein
VWTIAGPAAWTSQDAPGYVIVAVGTGYEVHLSGRRVGTGATFDAAVAIVADDQG